MQDTQQTTPGTAGASGFQTIPTRIRETPPLVVNKENAEINQQVTTRLHDLGVRLATVHRAAAEAYLSQAMYEEALPHAHGFSHLVGFVLGERAIGRSRRHLCHRARQRLHHARRG